MSRISFRSDVTVATRLGLCFGLLGLLTILLAACSDEATPGPADSNAISTPEPTPTVPAAWTVITGGRTLHEAALREGTARADVQGTYPDRETDLPGVTPLHVAARSNETMAVVQALLAAGADIEAKADDGWTPLHMAARYNKNPEVIQALLAAGADPNARAGRRTPLHWAADWNGNPEVIQALLDAGADPNATSAFGFTPLHEAARVIKNPKAVQALLDGGADPNARTDDGLTPLDFAMYFNSQEVVQALLDAGADPN